METCKKHSRFGFGIVLIAIGLVFFAGNFGLIPEPVYDVLTSWPMILVGVGLLNLFNGNRVPALILFAVAAFFLLPRIVPGVDMHDFRKYWPLLLIAIGAIFIVRRNKPHRPYRPSMVSNSEDYIDDISLFGGSVSQIESQNFKGGKITAVFGGSEIHMTRCRMADEGATIEMALVFGGTKLVVPRDWNVKLEVVSVFGGFADKRLYTNVDSPNAKTLVIKGAAVFGGGELSNA